MKISSKQVYFISFKVHKESTPDALIFWYIHKGWMKTIPHQIHCMALPDINFYFQVLQLLLLGNWGLLWPDYPERLRHQANLKTSNKPLFMLNNWKLSTHQISQALGTQCCKSNVMLLALMAKVFGGSQLSEVKMSWCKSSSMRETGAEINVFFFSQAPLASLASG